MNVLSAVRALLSALDFRGCVHRKPVRAISGPAPSILSKSERSVTPLYALRLRRVRLISKIARAKKTHSKASHYEAELRTLTARILAG